MTNAVWEAIFTPLPLERSAADVWRVDLTGPLSDEDLCLSPEELARANRFLSADDRSQWIKSHAALREILSNYLQIAPKEVAFELQQFGKPTLRGGGAAVAFNLSHTKGLALIVVARGNEVGVDVERNDRTLDPISLVDSVFAADERDAIVNASVSNRTKRFLELWTMKESWLKMNGCGLIDDLNRHSVLSTDTMPEDMRPAQILNVDLGPYYQAALCVRHAVDVLRMYEFDIYSANELELSNNCQ